MSGFRKTGYGTSPESNPLKPKGPPVCQCNWSYFECFGQCPTRISMQAVWPEVEFHCCSSHWDRHVGPRSGETLNCFTLEMPLVCMNWNVGLLTKTE